MDTQVSPKPASTLVLWSHIAESDPQVFMLKRQSQSGFMAGAHVFPGGALDEADLALADELSAESRAFAGDALDGCDDQRVALAFFIAAIRETAEESGFLLAIDEAGRYPQPHIVDTIVNGLSEGEPFSQLLDKSALIPDVTALSPISWWITPIIEKRRYDTRFFWANLPRGQTSRVSEQESSSGDFMNPKSALRAYREGQIMLAPPTIAILEELSSMATTHDLPNLFVRPIQPICPELASENNQKVFLTLPGDPLHSIDRRALPSRTRFEIDALGRFN